MKPKHREFADRVMASKDMNATRSYMETYPKSSEEAARRNAGRLMKRDDVKAYIRERMDVISEKTGITAERVLEELAAIGFANTTKAIYIANGKVHVPDTRSLDDGTKRAISEIRQTITKEGGTLSVKFHDKKGALELLGKHLGIFVEEDDSPELPMPTVVNVNVIDARKTE